MGSLEDLHLLHMMVLHGDSIVNLGELDKN